MKDIYESGEVMGLYSQIDLCYYMLDGIHKHLQRPLAPIERLIDNQTGYGKDQNKKAINDSIGLLLIIIKCKKKVEADYQADERLLKELKALKSRL